MNKQAWTIAKINLKNIRVTYFVTCLIFSVTFLESIVFTIVAAARHKAGNQLSVSSGVYFWLLVLLAAVFIPALHLRKIINLGGKRHSFFWGSMMTYTALAGVASLANTIYYYTFENFLNRTDYYVGFEAFMRDTSLLDDHFVNANLIELFGWHANGIVLVFIQQFAFLLLLAAIVHTLTAMQDKWYGWVTDIVIAAILAVFIPVSVLRPSLLAVFDFLIFNPNALIQITICLVLAIIIYALSKPIIAKKVI